MQNPGWRASWSANRRAGGVSPRIDASACNASNKVSPLAAGYPGAYAPGSPVTFDASRRPRPGRAAFTLVEMLVVITIIAILASLISVAVVAAKKKIIVMKVVNEINGLQTALEAYKHRFGDYPPDFAGVNDPNSVTAKPYNNGSMTTQAFAQATVARHLQSAFPRMGGAATVWTSTTAKLSVALVDATLLDPSTALAFWLGGMPMPATVDSKNNPASVLKQLTGFSSDSEYPFDNGTVRIAPFFQFDTSRLQAISTGSLSMHPPQFQSMPTTNASILVAFRYYPDLSTTGTTPQPYIYFSARSNYSCTLQTPTGSVPARGYDTRFQYWPTYDNLHDFINETPNILNSSGNLTPTKYSINVRPYFHLSHSNGISEWFNSDKFQIICTGLDGQYGAISQDTTPPSNNNQLPRGNSPAAPLVPAYSNIQGDGHFDNITNMGIIEDIK